MAKLIDLTGQRFGRLTVVERAENYVSPKGKQAARWVCQCDCGGKTVAVGGDLRYGRIKSCGCLEKESRRKRKNIKHGMFGTSLYNAWCAMKKRCLNPNNKYYERYGGRGITVCSEWINDFQEFYNWAVNHGYCKGLSLDRIDNDKGYSPENCRWATNEEQGNNKGNNRTFIINGKRYTLAELCKIYSKSRGKIEGRLSRGWTIEEALDLVPRRK